jgi:hypothetical protein
MTPIALQRSAGYTPLPPFSDAVGNLTSVGFEKALGFRAARRW